MATLEVPSIIMNNVEGPRFVSPNYQAVATNSIASPSTMMLDSLSKIFGKLDERELSIQMRQATNGLNDITTNFALDGLKKQQSQEFKSATDVERDYRRNDVELTKSISTLFKQYDHRVGRALDTTAHEAKNKALVAAKTKAQELADSYTYHQAVTELQQTDIDIMGRLDTSNGEKDFNNITPTEMIALRDKLYSDIETKRESTLTGVSAHLRPALAQQWDLMKAKVDNALTKIMEQGAKRNAQASAAGVVNDSYNSFLMTGSSRDVADIYGGVDRLYDVTHSSEGEQEEAVVFGRLTARSTAAMDFLGQILKQGDLLGAKSFAEASKPYVDEATYRLMMGSITAQQTQAHGKRKGDENTLYHIDTAMRNGIMQGLYQISQDGKTVFLDSKTIHKYCPIKYVENEFALAGWLQQENLYDEYRALVADKLRDHPNLKPADIAAIMTTAKYDLLLEKGNLTEEERDFLTKERDCVGGALGVVADYFPEHFVNALLREVHPEMSIYTKKNGMLAEIYRKSDDVTILAVTSQLQQDNPGKGLSAILLENGFSLDETTQAINTIEKINTISDFVTKENLTTSFTILRESDKLKEYIKDTQNIDDTLGIDDKHAVYNQLCRDYAWNVVVTLRSTWENNLPLMTENGTFVKGNKSLSQYISEALALLHDEKLTFDEILKPSITPQNK